ncbi:hypothetical protein J7E88_03640 [Streptomyces sp. ISL-10]|uniref:hypothetical protein n=1 Tax=Streptomyces sp. ISL-10 TaxID=2819172 RepID=UPI001BE52FCC|nr:hypothetical protein [Streptomyces sp. ISL-10]MBT2364440.1 hypothetical protein [Streptomyces sp. ISL-10]
MFRVTSDAFAAHAVIALTRAGRCLSIPLVPLAVRELTWRGGELLAAIGTACEDR